MSQVDRIIEASRYVAAAYSLVWVALVVYVVTLGTRVSRLQKELGLLTEIAERRAKKQADE